MKTITAAAFLVFGLAASGMAAEFKGFIEDEACSAKPAMKGDAACAKRCIDGGDKAVLVTPEGKVYKIADQDKVKAHAGHNVTITGDLKDGVLTVASVKM